MFTLFPPHFFFKGVPFVCFWSLFIRPPLSQLALCSSFLSFTLFFLKGTQAGGFCVFVNDSLFLFWFFVCSIRSNISANRLSPPSPPFFFVLIPFFRVWGIKEKKNERFSSRALVFVIGCKFKNLKKNTNRFFGRRPLISLFADTNAFFFPSSLFLYCLLRLTRFFSYYHTQFIFFLGILCCVFLFLFFVLLKTNQTNSKPANNHFNN